jgi:hypothetical protein
VAFNRRLSFIDWYLSRLVAVDPTDVINTSTRSKTVTRQVPKRAKAAIGFKEFAIFFIVCAYLKVSQNTWASVKENE